MPFFRRQRFLRNKLNYCFKPHGKRMCSLNEVILFQDEFEAVRLKDYNQLDQKEASEKMQLSQPTFHRLLKTGRKKIADALINNKILKIEGKIIMKKNEETIIAIAAKTNQKDSEIDSLFAKAPYFIIVTIKDNKIIDEKIIENKAAMQQGQAGITSAKTLIEMGVQYIICGNIGPRALDILKQFEIEVLTKTGSAKEALESFIGQIPTTKVEGL